MMSAANYDYDNSGVLAANAIVDEIQSVNLNNDISVFSMEGPLYVDSLTVMAKGASDTTWHEIYPGQEFVYGPEFVQVAAATGKRVISNFYLTVGDIVEVKLDYQAIGKYEDYELLQQIEQLESNAQLDRSDFLSWTQVKGSRLKMEVVSRDKQDLSGNLIDTLSEGLSKLLDRMSVPYADDDEMGQLVTSLATMVNDLNTTITNDVIPTLGNVSDALNNQSTDYQTLVDQINVINTTLDNLSNRVITTIPSQIEQLSSSITTLTDTVNTLNQTVSGRISQRISALEEKADGASSYSITQTPSPSGRTYGPYTLKNNAAISVDVFVYYPFTDGTHLTLHASNFNYPQGNLVGISPADNTGFGTDQSLDGNDLMRTQCGGGNVSVWLSTGTLGKTVDTANVQIYVNEGV